MSIITVKIAGRNFELSCPENSKEHLMSLVEKLNNKVQQVMQSNPSANFDLALLIVALGLQDEKNEKMLELGGYALEEANKDFNIVMIEIYDSLSKLKNKII